MYTFDLCNFDRIILYSGSSHKNPLSAETLLFKHHVSVHIEMSKHDMLENNPSTETTSLKTTALSVNNGECLYSNNAWYDKPAV